MANTTSSGLWGGGSGVGPLRQHQHLLAQGQGSRVFATVEHVHRTHAECTGVGQGHEGSVVHEHGRGGARRGRHHGFADAQTAGPERGYFAQIFSKMNSKDMVGLRA